MFSGKLRSVDSIMPKCKVKYSFKIFRSDFSFGFEGRCRFKGGGLVAGCLVHWGRVGATRGFGDDGGKEFAEFGVGDVGN